MSKKYLIILGILSICLLLVALWQWVTFHDGKLHVVFCDVGQGDAIFIRTPKGEEFLFDGGPDRRVMECLSRHKPFWEKDIDMLILSHPHQDHLVGFLDVLEKYHVLAFLTENLKNESATYVALQKTLAHKAITPKLLYKGDSLKTSDGITFKILSPTREFLAQSSPNSQIGESREFASIILALTYNKFSILLTGDSQAPQVLEAASNMSTPVAVLQVPHHGSKTGLTAEILNKLKPSLAVISVGKKNRYNHPSIETLELLKDAGIKTLRTDQHQDVEIVTDGKTWQVK